MKTVKVRVAVAIDADGKWSARGSYFDQPAWLKRRVMEDVEGGVVHWVEADLPVPESVTVQGEVKP